MRKVFLVLCLVLLMTGNAMAAEPLNDNQMDAVIAGDAGDALYGVATEAVFGNPHLGPAPTPPPNPEAPSLAYNESQPCEFCNGSPYCLSNCAAIAAAIAAAAAPPPPPPTPTQQFSSLLSTNGIGLR